MTDTETTDDAPLVSVIIPVYNRAGVLRRAIDSALAQTVEDIEVLVVDDGSTDDTAAVVGDYDDRVRYLPHDRNRGRSAARNTGIDAATGEYVAFLDSDDRWLPHKLERQLDRLPRCSTEWVGVYCEFLTPAPSRFGEALDWLSRHVFADPVVREGGRELAREILTMNVLMGPGSTLLVRREALEGLRFDEGLVDHEDWDFVLRLLDRGKIAHVDEPLVVVPESGGDPPAETLADAKRRFLDRHADRIDGFEAEGTDVRSIHRVSVAGVFLREGRLLDARRYLGWETLRDPRNWLRVPWWTLTGLRGRFGNGGVTR
ncbi:glycosyltransferase family 2 protein [Natronomonas gomsonensis]|uniref:glycosyltransferase n=1 Tax=Natronomonas gomsonensis TaxID=1046043 RepID=UPI0015BAF288